MYLLDDEVPESVHAEWAGELLNLGTRLGRLDQQKPGVRLVVAITVPTRNFAAALIAAGWVLAQPTECTLDVAQVLQDLEPGTPVRMMVGSELIADRYIRVEKIGTQHRVRVGGSAWLIEKIGWLMPAPDLDDHRFGRAVLSRPGSVVNWAGRAETWHISQGSCGADVVIVGTRSWLLGELGIRLGATDDLLADHNSLRELLRPDDGVRSAWASALLPAARFEEAVIPSECRLALLDGNSAIGWITDMTTEVVVAIIDRSISNDFAAESIMQLRSMAGIPLPLTDIGWHPPTGVEALAFEAWR